MDLIQAHQCSSMQGNYYVWRAKQLVANVESDQGRAGDARTRIENVLANMREHFDNKLHNAMDQHLG